MKKAGIVIGAAAAGTAAAASVEIFFRNFICRREPERWEEREKRKGTHWEQTVPLIRESQKWLQEQETEQVSIHSFDGLTLQGTFLPAQGEADRVVLAVHGYMGTGENNYCVMARFLHEKGYHVLIVDDRAHGRSEGAYNGFGCLDKEDCYRWVHYLNRRFEGKCSIFLHGISMGAAAVLMAAGLNLPPTVRGIVGDCGFTSPREEFLHMIHSRKILGGRLVLKLAEPLCRRRAGYGFSDYSASEAVTRTKIPVFIIHGAKDRYVPTRMGREIYQACASKKRLWIVPGAAHAESYYVAKQEYEMKMLQFYEDCIKDCRHEK